jgi:ubiquinone biosynthesis protein COQ9
MKKKTRSTPSATGDRLLRQRILDSFLAQAPFDGWTETSYVAALRQARITRTDADRILPNGVRDLVDLFGARADDAMQKRIDAERGFARFRVRDKIAFAVRARLEALTPHREAMRRLMTWYALPRHLPLGVKRLCKTVDLVWMAAGDTATDYNFYTKRILLAGVLKATILFWLNDETPDCAATWDFLGRRIADVMKLGKGISFLKEFKLAV